MKKAKNGPKSPKFDPKMGSEWGTTTAGLRKGVKEAKNGPKSPKFDPKLGSEWGNTHQGEGKG